MTPSHSVAAMGLTTLAMLAFAGNSILCRMALANGSIDPASFTAVRLVAGVAALALAIAWRRPARGVFDHGGWLGAAMLFAYAACFSFAYVSLAAATGALILFGFVQATMIVVALRRGDRPTGVELLGWLLAIGGLTVLLLPGATAPALSAALLMAAAGSAWGIYSILGKRESDPLSATCANFMRSLVFAIPLLIATSGHFSLSWNGVLLALASGALTSGLGYVIWYAALAYLTSLQGAVVQLSVPAIAALGGVVLLAEPLSLRTTLSGTAILGGVLFALIGKVRLAKAG